MPLPLPTEKAASAGTVTTQQVVNGEGSGSGRDLSTATVRGHESPTLGEFSVCIGMLLLGEPGLYCIVPQRKIDTRSCSNW